MGKKSRIFVKIPSKPSAIQIAKKNRADLRNLKSQIELKFHDVTSQADVDILQTGNLITLTNMAQGQTDETRNGDKVHAVNLDYRATVKISENTDVVRMILIWDKQNKITNAGDMMQVSIDNDPRSVLSAFKKDNRQQFLVLKDIVFAENLNFTASKKIRQIHFTRKLNKNIQFEAGGTTPLTGSLKVLWIGNTQNSNDQATLRHYSRVLYSDL